MKKISLCLLITLLLIPCWGCSANKSVDTYDTYTYMTTEKMITMSEAIQLAQDDDFVGYSIANLYFLKHYSISWGTCTAELTEDGNWTVKLKGNVSGYTDDYKTNYKSRESFSATVEVSSKGYVGLPNVKKY